LIELVCQELDLVNDAVGVSPVSVAEEIVAVVIQMAPLLVALVFHDIALLLKTLANVRVHGLEPVSQLGILIGILIELIDRGPQIIRRCTIGESLDEGLEEMLILIHTHLSDDSPHTLRSASAAVKADLVCLTVPAPSAVRDLPCLPYCSAKSSKVEMAC
jgi:hypothetical protein